MMKNRDVCVLHTKNVNFENGFVCIYEGDKEKVNEVHIITFSMCIGTVHPSYVGKLASLSMFLDKE